MDSGSIEIVVPTAAAPKAGASLAPRLVTLGGKRIGFRIEGGTELRGGALYQNFDFMASRFKEKLSSRYGIGTFPRMGSSWNPATADQVYDEFASQVDAAILGIAG